MKVPCYNIFLLPITPLSPHLWPQWRALPFVPVARNPAKSACYDSSCHLYLLPQFLSRQPVTEVPATSAHCLLTLNFTSYLQRRCLRTPRLHSG
ncbi:hypothetical protein Bpfe_025629 [Biomphalaria pfeifferi]|uniref:Uncharacterized protein n=1 Tax=Biomphalaria pfeifferi TaxID=112525 RepID=A0AAD8EZY0_BIOPF|nr:hypothetical protein Bpfe_025629 [Biomphalaria pfeifferi]